MQEGIKQHDDATLMDDSSQQPREDGKRREICLEVYDTLHMRFESKVR